MSALVENLIPLLLPAVIAPRVSPFKVTVTLVDAGMAEEEVVITMAVNDGAAEVPVEDPLINTFGVAAVLKKPEGYVKVTELPTASLPPTVVVKLNVADTPTLPATRSVAMIANVPAETCPPMTPDPIPTEGFTSALVYTTIPLLLPPFATPMTSPESVTVATSLATSVPLVTVTTIEVDEDATPTEPVDPPLINTVGNTPAAKKPDGYVNVILLPIARAPPAVGVKANVAADPVLPATQSLGTTKKNNSTTRSPIFPESTPAKNS